MRKRSPAYFICRIKPWNLKTAQPGFTGTSYLQALPDLDTLYQTNEITSSPVVSYPIYFTTPGTYTLWLRGYPTNAAGDSVYVGLGEVITDVTGFAPGEWSWANKSATLPVENSGVYTVSLWMREDGLRIDRLLLTTDTNFIPTSFGPAETERYVAGTAPPSMPLTRTLVYTYDNLYRLTEADYTSGENYQYAYDEVGNRLQQIINGDTTDYLYDAANRLEQLNGQPVYSFDNNGNLLSTGVMTNSFDAANRLIEAERGGTTVEPIYNGGYDRVGQTVDGITTTFALDVVGLPEVIYTSEGNAYLHLPGVIMAENDVGEVRYLLSDGLGSIRQATDETGQVVIYQEFDPYGNPVQSGDVPYGYTGEWWADDVSLLHLRARWYAPGTGTFLSVDPVESEPPYAYVGGNVVNLVDPLGLQPPVISEDEIISCYTDTPAEICYQYSLLPGPVQGKIPNPDPIIRPDTSTIPSIGPKVNQCYSDDWFTATGYAEGSAHTGAALFGVLYTSGREVVYNFATMERAQFTFVDNPIEVSQNSDFTFFLQSHSGLTTAAAELAYIEYDVQLDGFLSVSSLEADYSGDFFGFTGGGGWSMIGGFGGGFISVYSPGIQGSGEYKAVTGGFSPIPIVSGSMANTFYTFERETHHRYVSGSGYVTEREIRQMQDDIRSGIDSPWFSNIHTHASRQKAIKELEEVWQNHRYFFTSQYRDYQPRSQ